MLERTTKTYFILNIYPI